MIALLLKAGSDTARKDDEGQTVLFYALSYAPRVGQLLDHGAGLHARDRQGRTVLLRAVQGSYLKTVQVLLKHGVDVDAIDHQGETALHIAVRQAWEQEVALQALEADATQEQPKYAPALRLLWLVRERANVLLEIVRLLRQQGAQVDVPNRQGVTPLAYAGKAGGRGCFEH
jgi:ankyrin repeat protein